MTRGKNSQYTFDTLLADMSVSSLAFLMQKYKRDLQHIKQEHISEKEIQQIKQRYNMIKEEYLHRLHYGNLIEPDVHFTSSYDDVIIEYPLGRRKRFAILVSDSDVSYKEIEEMPK